MKKLVLKHIVMFTLPMLAIGVAPPNYAYPTQNDKDILNRINTPHQNTTNVQIGAFRTISNANQLKAKWASLVPFPVHIKHRGNYYDVIVGPIPSTHILRYEYNAPKLKVEASEFTSSHEDVIPRHENPIVAAKSSSRTPSKKPIWYSRSNGNSDTTGSWYVGIDGGAINASMASVMLINNGSDFSSPNNLDRYSIQASTPYFIGAEIGRFWHRDAAAFPGYALGLRYQYLFANHLTGHVMQYSTPEYTNYKYTWGVNANVFSLYSKIEVFKYGMVMPYLNGGVGISNNETNAYKESAFSDVTPRISPNFAGQSKSTFAYDLGAGLDFAIGPHHLLSLGYDYQNFGTFRSGSGKGADWSSQHLNLGTIKANTVLLGYTHLF